MVGSAWMPWLRPMVGVSLCSKRALLQRGQQRVEVGEQQVGGAHELHGEAGVEDVGGGHALVHEARLGPDDLGDVGEEGDDVVLDLALDLVDAGDVELGLASPSPRWPWRRSLGIRPSSAMASAACASISNQMRKRVSGAQIGGHLGPGVAGDHGRLLQVFGHRRSGSRAALAHQRQVRHIVGKREAPTTCSQQKPRDAP